jgi:hypothetical protein
MKRSACLALIVVANHLVLLGGIQPVVSAMAAPPAIGTDTPSRPAVQPITIGLKTRHSAIALAGTELGKYLGLMAGNSRAATVAAGPGTTAAQIELGLFGDFGVAVDGVTDPALDDAIYIDVRNSKGIVAGSNPRSVLFAVYRFLEASGCRWIRPGPDGDYVPSRRIDNLAVQLKDKAVYRFRGNSNGGSYSIDYILSKIEWGPKVGLNTFFNEFLIRRMSYANWYSRKYPSHRAPEPRTDTEIRAYHELLNREVKRRGLLLHAGGHGWNARFFGNPEVECDHEGHLEVPEDQTEYLALVGGERVKRGPTTTELCYGRAEVRQRLVQLVADYAEAHPEVDYLHFWLDDRMNDTCECELCRHKRVGDFYVMILNGIDRELSRRNIPTRIVFLIYQDLLWPPEAERLLNQGRFALMFAPISRLYDAPYEMPAEDLVLPPYQLNKNTSPHNIGQNVGFLRAWQRIFQGSGFVYDYHMVWYHYYDQGYYGLMDVLAEDIRRLPRLNLQGFVSCQTQKAFYPHGFPLYAHARLLWNPRNQVDSLAQDYFEGAFGKEGALALQHMKTLSDLFSPKYFYGKQRTREAIRPDDAEGQAVRKKLTLVDDAVQKFRPIIERNLPIGDPVHRLSWKYLSVHSGMAVLMADALRARVEGKPKDEVARWEAVRQYVVEHEDATESAFDLFRFQNTFPGLR